MNSFMRGLRSIPNNPKRALLVLPENPGSATQKDSRRKMGLRLIGVAVLLVSSLAAAQGNPVPVGVTSSGAHPPKIERLRDLSAARAAHQATLLKDGRVLISGGCEDQGCDHSLRSAEFYDTDAALFSVAAPMRTPRRDHAAVLLSDGRVLAAGGWTHAPTATAETYDPATDRWSRTGDMKEPRSGGVAVSLPDQRVLVIGGYVARGAAPASAEIFDPVTESFSPASPMHTPRRGLAAVALRDGRVLITGGASPAGEVLRSAELYDPASGQFVRTGDMEAARWAHAAVLLADGRVLVLGGLSPDTEPGARDDRLASTEIYDPITGEFSLGPTMHSPRRKILHSVAVLPGGAVLVAAGASRPELWDGRGKDFVLLEDELGERHEFASANVLRTGDVLVTGGYSRRIQPSASAWLIRVRGGL